ncbi:hypothetical protein [uncultured Paludibaculum sp.]|uniref:hypothetical protein n=1 Tax=uncultured Paludibaculum sp. TaxID=1765020 RepID=UPI002AAB1A7F|nr:hypothetical protein [uncultured Paludibaculum sp.]
MNKFLVLVIAVCAFVILLGVGREWKLKPETPANHMLHKGEMAVLVSTAGKAVWLAASKTDTYKMQIAMGKQDQAALDQAGVSGAAFPVVAGTHARVLEEDVSRLRIQLTDGPDAGRSGWVEFEYLRPIQPSETH